MFEGNTPIGFVAVLAIIVFSTKFLGLIFKHYGLPQVLGYIIAGILIGPAIFGEFCGFALIGFDEKCLFLLPGENALAIFSKVGVLLLMFSAGLETDLKELRHTGLAAALIACAGVAVPLLFGFLVSLPFGNIGLGFAAKENILRSVFIGTILTATSVAITVSVLKELGKVKTQLGTTLVSAAIIDDVIGVVLLSVVLGLAKSGSTDDMSGFEAFKSTTYGTVIMIICFFIFAILAGIVLSKCFKWLNKRWPAHHRIPVFSLAVCFGYSWIAEEIFGVADITGAFLAGVVLSTNHRVSEYTDKQIEVDAYTIFSPVFFANIGISSITFKGLSPMVLLFAVLAVIAGLTGKLLGCGAVAKAFKYNVRESAICGVGMMARGEVALIVTAAVTNSALSVSLPQEFMIMTVLLILVSSVLTPVFLKLLYSKKVPPEQQPPEGEVLTAEA